MSKYHSIVSIIYRKYKLNPDLPQCQVRFNEASNKLAEILMNSGKKAETISKNFHYVRPLTVRVPFHVSRDFLPAGEAG